MLVIGGCVSRQGGNPFRLATSPTIVRHIEPSEWPARRDAASDAADAAIARQKLRADEEYFEAIAPPLQEFPQDRTPLGEFGVGTLDRVDLETIAENRERLERARERNGLSEWLLFRSERTSVRPVSVIPIDEGRVDRMPQWLRLIEPSITSLVIFEPSGSPRGVVVHLASLAGYASYEMELVRALRNRGWLVLSTAIPTPRMLDEEIHLDLSAGPEAVGARLARAVDERLAEWAYAVEAALVYLKRERPGIDRLPLVGIGSSAGALTLPAVVARVGRRLDAAVLIGGGIDVLHIVRRTSLPLPPVKLSWANNIRPDAAQWEAIEQAYREAAVLDPTRTVRYLDGTPLLMLHAEFDTIVPADCGEALWIEAGRPERWCYAAGHLGLFLFWLPQEKDAIAEWIDETVRP